jgi:hypothetical protein
VKNNEEDAMNTESFKTVVGNEAVARVAFQLNEVIALFPIHGALQAGALSITFIATLKNPFTLSKAPSLHEDTT